MPDPVHERNLPSWGGECYDAMTVSLGATRAACRDAPYMSSNSRAGIGLPNK